MDLFGRCEYIAELTVMIGEIKDRRQEFAHVCFQKIRSLPDLRRQVTQIRTDDTVKHTLGVCFVEGVESVCKQSEGGT